MRTIGLCILILLAVVTCMAQSRLRMPELPAAKSLKVNDYTSLIFRAYKVQQLKVPGIAPDMYTRNFGFFCRQELKMYKAHVPVSVRLGTMQQCNTLERKK